MPRASREAAERYLTHLAEGDRSRLLALFADEPSIEDPMAGGVVGRASVDSFVKEREAWLRTHGARIEQLRTTHQPERTVVEYLLHVDVDGERYPLPCAVVGEAAEAGGLRQIRAYHSMWPLIGRHEIRRAILPPRDDLTLSDVVAAYQQALAAGDVEAIVATFEPGGYFREPAGGPHVYRRGAHSYRRLLTGSASAAWIAW